MKAPLLFCLAIGLVTGCSDNSSPPPAANPPAESTPPKQTSGGSVLTAPVDYLGAAGKAQQSAVKTVDTTAINQALQMFHVENGRYPKDLNELVQSKHLSQIPQPPYGTTLVYDAATGRVKIVKK